MKTFKVLTTAAVALILGFSSCSKEKGTDNSSAETYKVAISLKNTATRADGVLAISGTIVDINDGYICFVSANDAITDVYTISNAPTSGKNILSTDLGSTAVTLEGVPGTSAKVYMIANKGAVANFAAPVVGGTMTAYMANNMDVRDQGDYTSVTSTGDALLVAGGTAGTKTAAITLSTKVARIQLKDIKFEGDVSGKIAGIFINGYYPTMQLNGTAAALVRSSIAGDYDEAGGGTIFPAALKTFVFDDLNSKPFTAVALTPDVIEPNNAAWGYNLFVSATPQIIIKLTDVVVGTTPLAADQFITINGFKNNSTLDNIATLEGGMIYTIGAGAFIIKYENMSIEPGITPINVEVTVAPVIWQETIVLPNI